LNVGTGKEWRNILYAFDDGRPPVIAKTPADEDFISLFEIVNVTVNDESADLSSAEAIARATRQRPRARGRSRERRSRRWEQRLACVVAQI
jgi:hypothetical protein